MIFTPQTHNQMYSMVNRSSQIKRQIAGNIGAKGEDVAGGISGMLENTRADGLLLVEGLEATSNQKNLGAGTTKHPTVNSHDTNRVTQSKNHHQIDLALPAAERTNHLLPILASFHSH